MTLKRETLFKLLPLIDPLPWGLDEIPPIPCDRGTDTRSICRGSNSSLLAWSGSSYQLRCRPPHLTLIQNQEVLVGSKLSCCFTARGEFKSNNQSRSRKGLQGTFVFPEGHYVK
ncbi:hypothetical protein TNCV_3104941 [Trichonephila clavipes]|nr:hypothetical protein TNCV_3104941 [Trichonephila clavipes]